MAVSRPSTVTSSPPGPQRSKIYYIHELPYCDLHQLARHLNADRKWAILAGHMKFDTTDIGIFANATSRDGGPAEEVLKTFGQRNGKIRQVYKYLYQMKYFVGMRIIKKHVDPKYWCYLDEEDSSGTSFETIERYTPTARPCASGVPKLEPDRRNVNCQRSEPDLKAHHKSSKLPTHTGKLPIVLQLPNLIKVLSLEDLKLDPAKLSNDRKKPIDFSDIDLGSIKKIPHTQLALATQGFQAANVIGRGGFGVVYRGNWKDIDVAIKKLKVSKPGSEEHIRQVLTELRVLEKCRFQNILALYGISIDNRNEPCLVYEFMPCGSLDDRLKRKASSHQPLTWSQRAVIARGTARGLNYLHTVHDTPLVHGDVKPANILLDVNLEPKLGDFGLTREGPIDAQTHRFVSHVHGTRYYLPDEYLQARKLSPKVDVYSFGIVLLELATCLKVYDEQRSHKKLTLHIQSLRSKSEHWKSKDPNGGEGGLATFEVFIELGLKCASLSKNDRPNMDKVLDVLKDGRLVQNSPLVLPAGYSRDPTVTLNQNLGPMNLPVVASRSPRLSPTDNLQVPSPVPPTATTNLSPCMEVRQNNPETAVTRLPAMTVNQLPAISLLNITGNMTNSESSQDTSPN